MTAMRRMTQQERAALRAIEARLVEEEPALAALLASGPLSAPSWLSPLRWRASALAGLGGVFLIAGLYLKVESALLLGLALLAVLVWRCAPLRVVRHLSEAAQGGEPRLR